MGVRRKCQVIVDLVLQLQSLKRLVLFCEEEVTIPDLISDIKSLEYVWLNGAIRRLPEGILRLDLPFFVERPRGAEKESPQTKAETNPFAKHDAISSTLITFLSDSAQYKDYYSRVIMPAEDLPFDKWVAKISESDEQLRPLIEAQMRLSNAQDRSSKPDSVRLDLRSAMLRMAFARAEQVLGRDFERGTDTPRIKGRGPKKRPPEGYFLGGRHTAGRPAPRNRK